MKQAMIFAAGLGTRLRPLTDDRPKALVEVAGRPLLEHLVLKLRAAGFERIVVNVHHFADKVIDFLHQHDDFGLDIRISDERQLLLNTGGGLKAALPLLDPAEPTLIHNVDILSDVDLGALYAEAALPGAPAALLAVNRRETSRFLLFNDEWLLRGWLNVRPAGQPPVSKVSGSLPAYQLQRVGFTGIHVLTPAVYPLLHDYPGEVFSIIDFYLSACRQVPIGAHLLPASTRWMDCGKPEAISRAAALLSAPADGQ